jgi:pilus assembly protein Flp/PilA
MIKLNKRLTTLRKSQKGLTTVEYAIAGGLIAGGVILAFGLLGTNISAVVNAIANALGPIAAAI